jgi:hypothetical protein
MMDYDDLKPENKHNSRVCARCGKVKPTHRWWIIMLPHGLDKQNTRPYCKKCYEKKIVEDAIQTNSGNPTKKEEQTE